MPHIIRSILAMFAASFLGVATAGATTQDFSQVAGPTSGGAGDSFVIFYSGDGGWAGLDRAVGDEIGKTGVPVVGVDSLRYFMKSRKAEDLAADLAAAIDRYGAQFGRRRVVLAGYSFGADALPLIVERLPPAERAKVKMLALISIGDRGELTFHPGAWLNLASADAEPLRPALTALKGLPVVCLRGSAESQSGCLHMADLVTETVSLPGSHHYAGHYNELGKVLAERISAGKG